MGLQKSDEHSDGQKSPRGSGMGVPVGIALGIILLGFMLMGMPGMAVFYVGDMPFGGRMNPIRGDKYLEVGMWTNILWPVCIPVAHLLRRRVLSRSAFARGPRPNSGRTFAATLAVYALVLYAWAVLVAALLHSLVPSGG